MPEGPPPYPVYFKEFFITDPKTGKQTMKVQMFPYQVMMNEADEISDDSSDDNELDEQDSNSFLNNWQHYYHTYGTIYDHPAYEAEYAQYPSGRGTVHDLAHGVPGTVHYGEGVGYDPREHEYGYLDHRSPDHWHYADADHYLGVRPSHDHLKPFEQHLLQRHMEREAEQERHMLEETRASWHAGQDPAFN